MSSTTVWDVVGIVYVCLYMYNTYIVYSVLYYMYACVQCVAKCMHC